MIFSLEIEVADPCSPTSKMECVFFFLRAWLQAFRRVVVDDL